MKTLLLSLLLSTCLACTHPRTADDASDQNATPNDTENETEQAQTESPKLADPQHAGKRKGLIAGGAKDPERVPVASSPAGLLKPGAEEKVREKLGPKAKGE